MPVTPSQWRALGTQGAADANQLRRVAYDFASYLEAEQRVLLEPDPKRKERLKVQAANKRAGLKIKTQQVAEMGQRIDNFQAVLTEELQDLS